MRAAKGSDILVVVGDDVRVFRRAHYTQEGAVPHPTAAHATPATVESADEIAGKFRFPAPGPGLAPLRPAPCPTERFPRALLLASHAAVTHTLSTTGDSHPHFSPPPAPPPAGEDAVRELAAAVAALLAYTEAPCISSAAASRAPPAPSPAAPTTAATAARKKKQPGNSTEWRGKFDAVVERKNAVLRDVLALRAAARAAAIADPEARGIAADRAVRAAGAWHLRRSSPGLLPLALPISAGAGTPTTRGALSTVWAAGPLRPAAAAAAHTLAAARVLQRALAASPPLPQGPSTPLRALLLELIAVLGTPPSPPLTTTLLASVLEAAPPLGDEAAEVVAGVLKSLAVGGDGRAGWAVTGVCAEECAHEG